MGEKDDMYITTYIHHNLPKNLVMRTLNKSISEIRLGCFVAMFKN